MNKDRQTLKRPNQNYWSKMTNIELWKAVLLLSDIDPLVIERGNYYKMRGTESDVLIFGMSSEVLKIIDDSKYSLAVSHVSSGALKTFSFDEKYPEKSLVHIIDFSKWAVNYFRSNEIPEWIANLAKNRKSSEHMRRDLRQSFCFVIKCLLEIAKIDTTTCTINKIADMLLVEATKLEIPLENSTARDILKQAIKAEHQRSTSKQPKVKKQKK